MNASDVKGFRPSALAKLGDVKTSTRPLRTISQYVADILFKTSREHLSWVESLKSMPKVQRIDKSAQDAEVANIRTSIAKISGTVSKADDTDPMKIIMSDFLAVIKPRAAEVEEAVKRLDERVFDTAVFFGEKEAQAKKLTINTFLQPINKFVQEVTARVKDLTVIEEKEKKRAEVLAKRAEAEAGKKKAKAVAKEAVRVQQREVLPEIGETLDPEMRLGPRVAA